jgi:hypothetical protein
MSGKGWNGSSIFRRKAIVLQPMLLTLDSMCSINNRNLKNENPTDENLQVNLRRCYAMATVK